MLCAGWDMVMSVLGNDVGYSGVLLAYNYQIEPSYEQVLNECWRCV
jgi:hypothetical protein